MICRLCLRDITKVIQIFDVVGLELNVAMVLNKYFWFKPKKDDPISTAICNDCWITVSNFHEFYLSVEEAHRLLTERFSIKTENKSSQREQTDADTISVKLTKCEVANKDKQTNSTHEAEVSDDSEDGITFNVLLEADDVGEDDVESEAENKSLIASTVENCMSAEMVEGTQDKKYIEHDEILFDEQYFVEKILDDAHHLDDEEDKLLIKEEPLEAHELRRSTRHSKTKAIDIKSNTQNQCHGTRSREKHRKLNDSLIVNETKEGTQLKRRGRPRKSSDNPQRRLCKQKQVELTAQRCRERALKSQANDEKITSYMRLSCHICSEVLPTFAHLRVHTKLQHQQKAYAVCCNKKFYKRVLLVDHIDKHLDPECYKCDQCQKIFADKQCLRNHMLLKHQPDEVKTFACDQCTKKFAKPYLLEQHMIVHASRDHICNVCKRGFPSAPQLTSHIKLTHTSTYGTMCHICAKLIRGRAAFERHQLEHTGVILPKVQCEKCGSWHKDKYSLQKHVRRHNDDGTVHVCHICNKVSPNRSSLLSHFRYVHAAKRTYECGVCKKAFKKPLNLKEHMTMHTGEVLYSCPYCPKTFNSNANMHSHRKKMHPREFEEQRKLRRGMTIAEAAQQRQQVSSEKQETTAVLSTTGLSTDDPNTISIIYTTS